MCGTNVFHCIIIATHTRAQFGFWHLSISFWFDTILLGFFRFFVERLCKHLAANEYPNKTLVSFVPFQEKPNSTESFWVKNFTMCVHCKLRSLSTHIIYGEIDMGTSWKSTRQGRQFQPKTICIIAFKAIVSCFLFWCKTGEEDCVIAMLHLYWLFETSRIQNLNTLKLLFGNFFRCSVFKRQCNCFLCQRLFESNENLRLGDVHLKTFIAIIRLIQHVSP